MSAQRERLSNARATSNETTQVRKTGGERRKERRCCAEGKLLWPGKKTAGEAGRGESDERKE